MQSSRALFSMTAARSCSAEASPANRKKFRGCSADQADRAERKDIGGRCCSMFEQEDVGCVGGCFDVRARFACFLPVGRETLPPCIGNTRELDN